MRVLVCGDRNWTDPSPIMLELIKLEGETTIVHGAARGADTLGGLAAEFLGMNVEAHPAKWQEYGRAAGPIRNQEMLDSGLDLVLAFHENISSSKGTKDMIRRAKKDGIPIKLVEG